MSVSEKESLSASRDLDPLLKDLSEKQQSFRRNVVSLAADLKDVRCRLVSQEGSCARELMNRQAVERKARSMEAEIFQLQKSLEERNGQLQSSASTTKQFLKELDDIRNQLYGTQATADASAASAQSAQLHCLELAKEFDEKKSTLNEHENHMNRLTEQLNNLQMDLQARETLQKQLKDEVLRIEKDIMQALTRATASKDCELRKILDEVAPKNLEKISNLIVLKDEETAKLRDEIRVLSAHWKFKTKEMESQLEKNRKVDQELKKRVLKLEFCLQETRTQTRKLQRMGELRDKALKEIRELLETKQPGTAATVDKQNFWESPNFKIAVSMSMLILVVFAKR